MGLVTGAFYLRFRDLCPTMLVHITYNAASALLLNVGSRHFTEDSPIMYYTMVAGCTGALVAGYFLLQRIVPPKSTTKAASLPGKPLLHTERSV